MQTKKHPQHSNVADVYYSFTEKHKATETAQSQIIIQNKLQHTHTNSANELQTRFLRRLDFYKYTWITHLNICDDIKAFLIFHFNLPPSSASTHDIQSVRPIG